MIYFLSTEHNNVSSFPIDISIMQSDEILVTENASQALLSMVYRDSSRIAHVTVDGAEAPGLDPAYYGFTYGGNEDDDDLSEVLRCRNIINPYDQVTVEVGFITFSENTEDGLECITSKEMILEHRDILRNSPFRGWNLYRVSIYASHISFDFHETGTGGDFEVVRLKTPMQQGSQLNIEMPINGILGYAHTLSSDRHLLSLSITTPREGETVISTDLNGKVTPIVQLVADGDGVAIRKFYPLNSETEKYLGRLLEFKNGCVYW